MTQIKCEECGIAISFSNSSCPECGCPVEKISCYECGEDFPQNANACPNCGCPNDYELKVESEEGYEEHSEESNEINDQIREEFFISCYECGEDFPQNANACPNCGCPKGEVRTLQREGREIDEEKKREKEEEERRQADLRRRADEENRRELEAYQREKEREEEERRQADLRRRANERSISVNNETRSRPPSSMNASNQRINFCSNCGAEIKIATNFCTKCGYKFSYKSGENSDKGRQSINNIKSIKFLDNPNVNLIVAFVFLAAVFTQVNLIFPIILILIVYIAIKRISA